MRKKEDRPIFKPEQKLLYIQYVQKNKETLMTYFKRIYLFEKQFEKDIVDMNKNELKDTIIGLNIRSRPTVNHFISLMRGYYDWALLKGYTQNKKFIHQINSDMTDTEEATECRMIGSPEHLDYILEVSSQEDERPNRSKLDKLVFKLLYAGIPMGELPYILGNSINADGTIQFNIVQDDVEVTKLYKVNQETYKLWQVCNGLTYVERLPSVSENNKKKEGMYKKPESKLVDNDYLFRPTKGSGTDDKQANSSFFTSIISGVYERYSESTKKRLKVSPKDIVISGKYYEIYTEELNGLVVSQHEMGKRFGVNIGSKTKKLLLDYEDWKIAFDHE